jgi:peptidoglycan/LPS O-acetylase OafA/YrhL
MDTRLIFAIANAVLAGVCGVFAYDEVRHRRRAGAALLIALTIVLGLLALQHGFGLLEVTITAEAREAARRDGWYGQRRELQRAAVGAILPVCLVCLVGTILLLRHGWRRYLPLLLALTFLIGFGALQAVSLHQWDARLRHLYFGIPLRAWGDIAGLIGVCGALLWFYRQTPVQEDSGGELIEDSAGDIAVRRFRERR